MGQECCALVSFYYNNEVLFYGKMCYLYYIVYSTNSSAFFSTTVNPLLGDMVQTHKELPQRYELTVILQMHTSSHAEYL